MKNINDSIDTLHVTLYKIQINVWTCRDCHRHCTTFFSLKPKIDNPFLIPFKCKFHINGAFFYIEVLGLICSLQRTLDHGTLDQGTSTLKVMEIECQTHHLFVRQHFCICSENWKSVIITYYWWSLYG